MKRYYVYEGMNRFESNSRNAVQHAIDGGLPVTVTTKKGKVLSRAGIDINGIPYRIYVDKNERI